MIQFCPTWATKETEWAKQYGGAADALEGDARLVKVNALTDTAILERFGIAMTQRDEDPRRAGLGPVPIGDDEGLGPPRGSARRGYTPPSGRRFQK